MISVAIGLLVLAIGQQSTFAEGWNERRLHEASAKLFAEHTAPDMSEVELESGVLIINYFDGAYSRLGNVTLISPTEDGSWKLEERWAIAPVRSYGPGNTETRHPGRTCFESAYLLNADQAETLDAYLKSDLHAQTYSHDACSHCMIGYMNIWSDGREHVFHRKGSGSMPIRDGKIFEDDVSDMMAFLRGLSRFQTVDEKACNNGAGLARLPFDADLYQKFFPPNDPIYRIPKE